MSPEHLTPRATKYVTIPPPLLGSRRREQAIKRFLTDAPGLARTRTLLTKAAEKIRSRPRCSRSTRPWPTSRTTPGGCA